MNGNKIDLYYNVSNNIFKIFENYVKKIVQSTHAYNLNTYTNKLKYDNQLPNKNGVICQSLLSL